MIVRKIRRGDVRVYVYVYRRSLYIYTYIHSISTSVQLKNVYHFALKIYADHDNCYIPDSWIVSQPCTICSLPQRNTQLGWTDLGLFSMHPRLSWTDTLRTPWTTCFSHVSRCRCSPPERFRFPATSPFPRPSRMWSASSPDRLLRSSPAPRCPVARASGVCWWCRVSEIKKRLTLLEKMILDI